MTGRLEAAEDSYRRVAATPEAGLLARAGAGHKLGLALFEQNDHDGALAAFAANHALYVPPFPLLNRAERMSVSGYCHARRQERDRAKACFTEAIDLLRDLHHYTEAVRVLGGLTNLFSAAAVAEGKPAETAAEETLRLKGRFPELFSRVFDRAGVSGPRV